MRILLVLAMVAAAGCGRADPDNAEPSTEALLVYTTFYPTTYFAERIGGELVEVRCITPDDVDPLHWHPTREDIAALRDADLIILHGAGVESWAEQVALPESRVVVATDSFADRLIHTETATHSHGPGGEHTHGEIDPHTWLDPLNAVALADGIRDALAKRLPAHAEAFTSAHSALVGDLDSLHDSLGGLSVDGVTILCSHPAYNYLAEGNNWSVVNFDLDPEQPIGSPEWAAIATAAQSENDRTVMLWESAPLDETAARLSDDLGIVSVVFGPCEVAPETGDYFSAMRANIQSLGEALSD